MNILDDKNMFLEFCFQGEINVKVIENLKLNWEKQVNHNKDTSKNSFKNGPTKLFEDETKKLLGNYFVDIK